MSELAREHRWQELASLAGDAAQKNPLDAQALFWLGSAELELQHFIRAEQALRAAEKLGLDDAALHEQLGLAYYRLNQFLLFEREMDLAAQRNPRDFLPPYSLGLYQLTVRSDLPKALADFDAAASLAPDDWKVMYEEGNCWEKQGRNDKARDYYVRSAASVEKNNQAFGWPFQGLARLALQENPSEALEYAKKAVDREPQEYSNHLVLARVYSQLGRDSEAITEAKAAVAENPSDSDTRYLLFRLYRRTGANDAAAQELQTFKELKAAYGEP